jgi:O-acetyl-ADP-ribose deacetylase
MSVTPKDSNSFSEGQKKFSVHESAVRKVNIGGSEHEIQPEKVADEADKIVGDVLNSDDKVQFTPKVLRDLTATNITEVIKNVDLKDLRLGNSETLDELNAIVVEHESELDSVFISDTPYRPSLTKEPIKEEKRDAVDKLIPEKKSETLPIDEMLKKDLEELRKSEEVFQHPLQVSDEDLRVLDKFEASKKYLDSTLVKDSRPHNPYFYGIMTVPQVESELKNLKPSEAIFYYSPDEQPMVSFLESGEPKHVLIKEDALVINLKEAAGERKLIKPSFSVAWKSDIKKLGKDEAIVRYQNGCSFAIKNGKDGSVLNGNYFGADIINTKLKLFYTSEDIEKKPYYFGKISNFEAKKILSQQEGPAMLVRKKGDVYYLHQKGEKEGKPISTPGSLIDSKELLKLEKEGRGNLVKPKGMDALSYKLQSYGDLLRRKSQVLVEGVHVQAVAFARRFFPYVEARNGPPVKASAPVVQKKLIDESLDDLEPIADDLEPIADDLEPIADDLESIAEKSLTLLNELRLSKYDWGNVEEEEVKGILKDARDGLSIVWRDPNYEGIIVSSKVQGQVVDHKFSSASEYWKSARGLGFLMPPNATKSLSYEKDVFSEKPVNKQVKTELEFIDEMMGSLHFKNDLPGFIQETLKNNPGKIEFIIKTLQSWQTDPSIKQYHSLINKQLVKLRLIQQLEEVKSKLSYLAKSSFVRMETPDYEPTTNQEEVEAFWEIKNNLAYLLNYNGEGLEKFINEFLNKFKSQPMKDLLVKALESFQDEEKTNINNKAKANLKIELDKLKVQIDVSKHEVDQEALSYQDALDMAASEIDIDEMLQDLAAMRAKMTTPRDSSLSIQELHTYPQDLTTDQKSGIRSEWQGDDRLNLTFPQSQGFDVSIRGQDMFESGASVIVSAANLVLRGGDGIDKAIHKQGGESYAQEHKKLQDKEEYKKGYVSGYAEMIGSGDLSTNHAIDNVIVVAGPRGPRTNPEKESQLYSCYYNSLVLAHSQGKASIAFPSISTGSTDSSNFPKDKAAEISLRAIYDFTKKYPNSPLKTISIHFLKDDPKADLQNYAKALTPEVS